MRKQKEHLDIGALLQQVGSELSQAAREPNILMYKPHEKQEIFHKQKCYARFYFGGNRSGKTYSAVVEDIWWATGTHPYQETPPPPVRGRVVAVDFTFGVGQVIIPLFKRLTTNSMLKGGSWDTAYNKNDRVLTFENGSTIEFMSYDQDLDKFAGTSRHFIHFDEEPPKSVFDENMQRLLDVEGHYWVSMTPVEGITWLFDLIYEAVRTAPDMELIREAGPEYGQVMFCPSMETLVVEVDQGENPHLSTVGRARAAMTLTDEEKTARQQGKFVEMAGLVYKQFDPKIHVIESFIPPKDWEWYSSTDHGWNNPTATLWHAVSPDGTVYTFSEHYASEMTVAEHATTMHVREQLWGREPDVRVGDPAMHQHNGVTGTSIIQEYASHGIYIATESIPRDVQIGVARIQQYLYVNPATNKPRWYITEDCVNLIREIRRLRWKKYASKKTQMENNKSEQIHKKDDHACDSARYFFTCMPELTMADYVDPNLPPEPGPQMNMDYGGALLKALTEGRAMPEDAQWDIFEGVDLADLTD